MIQKHPGDTEMGVPALAIAEAAGGKPWPPGVAIQAPGLVIGL